MNDVYFTRALMMVLTTHHNLTLALLSEQEKQGSDM